MSRAELDREKLLHAIVFFVKKTHACHKLKLFKLLFFADFEIFRQTGRSVTGLLYFAWPMGPVPRSLYEEFQAPRPDMKSVLFLRVASEDDPDFTTKRLTITARTPFDDGCFTARELAAMEKLAEIYRDARAEDMIEVTHLSGEPWHQVYEVENRPQELIPYTLALDSKPCSISREMAKEIAEEARETDALFK